MNFALDSSRCPLCGRANNCQLCTASTYKGPCWCAKVEIPADLLAQVPADLRNRACICPECVEMFRRQRARISPPRLLPGDFYFEQGGLMVLNAAYLLRQGFCCGGGCRHCPYPARETTPARV